MSKRLKILLLILLLMIIGTVYLAMSVKGESTASLIPNNTNIKKGETFTITLWINTDIESRGFVLRQLTYDSNKAQLISTTFNGTIWELADFKDLGHIKPGNLTYAQAGNLDKGYMGNNKSFIMTFKGLKKGTVNFGIPLIIWSGQPGVELVDVNNITWTNTKVTITDSSTPPSPPSPPSPPGEPPEEPEENLIPVANGNGPYTAYINEPITVNASNSYDPDGTIIKYLWIFSDGTNSTEITTNHIYSEVGNYTIKLTVWDDDGNFSDYYTYAFITEEKEPEPPEEPEEPEEPEDNKITPAKKEDSPLIYIGIILICILIFLIFIWISKRKND